MVTAQNITDETHFINRCSSCCTDNHYDYNRLIVMSAKNRYFKFIPIFKAIFLL